MTPEPLLSPLILTNRNHLLNLSPPARTTRLIWSWTSLSATAHAAPSLHRLPTFPFVLSPLPQGSLPRLSSREQSPSCAPFFVARPRAAVPHVCAWLAAGRPPAPPLPLCRLVAVSVPTATLQSPSRDPCKSVWDVSVTCFTPGGVPACKGIVLVRENKSHGPIRRHFGGRWPHSVGYLNVNLL